MRCLKDFRNLLLCVGLVIPLVALLQTFAKAPASTAHAHETDSRDKAQNKLESNFYTSKDFYTEGQLRSLELEAWKDKIIDELNRNFRTRISPKSGKSYVVQVTFTISRQGQIKLAEITQKSANKTVNAIALQSITDLKKSPLVQRLKANGLEKDVTIITLLRTQKSNLPPGLEWSN